MSAQEPLYIVFDGLPGHQAPQFVEVETAAGKSVRLGEWEPYGKLFRLGPVYAAPFAVSEKGASDSDIVRQLEGALVNSEGRDFTIRADFVREVIARIAALEAELAAARKDAERYRWLRSYAGDYDDTYTAKLLLAGTDAEFDATIDAARREKP